MKCPSPCTCIIKRLGYVWPSWEQRKIPEVICFQDTQFLGAPDEHSNLVYLEIKNMFILGKEQNISIGKKNSSHQEGETLRRIFYNFKNRQTFIDRKILAVMFSWQDVIIFSVKCLVLTVCVNVLCLTGWMIESYIVYPCPKISHPWNDIYKLKIC